MELVIGCHVSIGGGIDNAPKNAHALGCETFQIFTRPPQGGKAPQLDDLTVEKFKHEMRKYYPPSNSPPKIGGGEGGVFVVHCPYFINFGSAEPKIYYGSIAVVGEELRRANLLDAKYVMTHLGSAKALGQKKALKQTKEGLVKVLEEYQGQTRFLLEIAAGAGEIIGDNFEELAEIMEPLKKFKTFGGICFDTQHAFASGYDLRDEKAVVLTFRKFDKTIGLKWLKMSHINDSKADLGERKDRHAHIGEGQIGVKGFEAFLGFLHKNLQSEILNLKSGEAWPLILETEHDKVKADIKILKKLRDKIK